MLSTIEHFHHYRALTNLDQVVMLLTCIQGVPSSNLGQDTNYSEEFHGFSALP
jgi:hypothetical protein